MSERKKIGKKKSFSVEDQEKALAALQTETSAPAPTSRVATAKPSNKTQRVTVDFPQAMYEEMKSLTQLNGQTLKGYIVSLVRKNLKDNS